MAKDFKTIPQSALLNQEEAELGQLLDSHEVKDLVQPENQKQPQEGDWAWGEYDEDGVWRWY